MDIYALIGKSGTGKSYKAQYVSRDYGIEYIIDDGLLISGTRVVAGTSAKKESTKVAAIRRAIFSDASHRKEVREAIERLHPSSILVLGTSDEMVDRILQSLGLPPPVKKIYIEDISTRREMDTASRVRKEQGKHVIPVPTFAIKKDFSGYFIDSIKNFAKRDKEQPSEDIEKTVVRPTFSYLGRYTISDNVIKSMAAFAGQKAKGVHKITKVSIENTQQGLKITMDLSIDYGYIIPQVIEEMRAIVKNEIEHMTAFNILEINVNVRTLNMNP